VHNCHHFERSEVEVCKGSKLKNFLWQGTKERETREQSYNIKELYIPVMCHDNWSVGKNRGNTAHFPEIQELTGQSKTTAKWKVQWLPVETMTCHGSNNIATNSTMPPTINKCKTNYKSNLTSCYTLNAKFGSEMDPVIYRAVQT